VRLDSKLALNSQERVNMTDSNKDNTEYRSIITTETLSQAYDLGYNMALQHALQIMTLFYDHDKIQQAVNEIKKLYKR